MTLKMLAVFAALAFVLPGTAHAQNKHSHSHAEKGPHGGRLADAGDYHVELVARDGGIEVYVVDHGEKPLALSGFKGLAILAVDGKSSAHYAGRWRRRQNDRQGHRQSPETAEGRDPDHPGRQDRVGEVLASVIGGAPATKQSFCLEKLDCFACARERAFKPDYSASGRLP